MKLYTFDPAPNPRRLELFIQYKGIEIATQQIDLLKGEQFEDSYQQINPLCTVPTLVLDDGSVLSQTIGICLYLESIFPDKPLMGRDALEKAQVISWDHRIFLEGLLPIAEVFRNSNPGFASRALPGVEKVEQIPDLVARGVQLLRAFWRNMEKEMQQRNYVAGDSFSQADIDLIAVVGFAGWIKQSIPADCTHLQQWYSRAGGELGISA